MQIMEEHLSKKVDLIEAKVIQLRKVSKEAAVATLGITEMMQKINENMKDLIEANVCISAKLRELSADFHQRRISKLINKSLVAFFPWIMISALLVTSVDHDKFFKVLETAISVSFR